MACQAAPEVEVGELEADVGSEVSEAWIVLIEVLMNEVELAWLEVASTEVATMVVDELVLAVVVALWRITEVEDEVAAAGTEVKDQEE